MKYFFLIHFFLIFSIQLYSQENRDVTYLLSDDDAIILSEYSQIDFEHFDKNSLATVLISNKKSIHLKSDKGVTRFSELVLPESFDPTFKIHAPKARNFEEVFYDIRIVNLAVKVEKPNGEIIDIEFSKSLDEIDVASYYSDNYAKYYYPRFTFPDLEINDKLLIEYQYRVDIGENFNLLTSFRVFFNSDIKRNNFDFRIRHLRTNPVELSYFNGAEPDTIFEEKNYLNYHWHRKGLKGNICELGSRPYNELQYININLIYYRLLFVLYKDNSESYIPYNTIFAQVREQDFFRIIDDAIHGVNTKQNLKMNKFISNQIKDLENDSIGYYKLMSIHNEIASNFDFIPDIDFFRKKDIRDPRPGTFVEKKQIRDIARNDLYVYFLTRLDFPIYTSYLLDKRSGSFLDKFYKSMFYNDVVFMVPLKNNTFHYLYPKSKKLGYFMNEFPFYYEGTSSILVNFLDYKKEDVMQSFYYNYRHPSSMLLGDFNAAMSTLLNSAGGIEYSHYKTYLKENPDEDRIVKLPNSTINDNTRKTNTLININLETKKMDFKSRINLSGQYSTMTRGVYLYHVKDETVNPLYNEKVWENIEAVCDTSSKVDIVSQEFPFNANVNATFTSSELIHQNSDTLEINFSNWFKHIIYPGMDLENRTLDFYPDFQGRDTYVYFLKFDKDVELLMNFDDVDIQNDFGELKISIEQMDSKSIKISSLFAVSADKIEAENVNQIGEIFKSIELLNAQKLKLHLTQ